MLPRLFRVTKRRRETRDTVTLDLESVEDSSGFVFSPGQFNMLYAFGVGEAAISISGDPAEAGRLTHTVRSVGAVTDAICRLRPGEALGVRGPFGSRWPVGEDASDVVIVAGGIGMAPLRPVLYALLSKRERYGKVVLLYGARTPDDVLYASELKKWRGRFDVQVEVTVDGAGPRWRGHVGVVTTLIPKASFDPARTVAMVCGPEVMMRFTVRELENRGVPPERITMSMERNMKCAVGFCGHCQFGPRFVCKDGPVFRYGDIREWFGKREI